jgi:hypothetical protein
MRVVPSALRFHALSRRASRTAQDECFFEEAAGLGGTSEEKQGLAEGAQSHGQQAWITDCPRLGNALFEHRLDTLDTSAADLGLAQPVQRSRALDIRSCRCACQSYPQPLNTLPCKAPCLP